MHRTQEGVDVIREMAKEIGTLKKKVSDLESREEITHLIKTTTGDPASGQSGLFVENTFDNNLRVYTEGLFRNVITTRDASALTIDSGGAITITQTIHVIDTFGAAASDNLDTINGGVDGRIIILYAADNARTVVCRDNADNLRMNGNFSLDNVHDTIMFFYDGAIWKELSRSNNAA